LATDRKIRTNELVKLQRVILEVMDFPEAKQTSNEQVSAVFKDRVKTIELNANRIYEGLEKDGQTVKGYAFPVGGPGFWGPIYGMVGVGPQGERILNIDFYQHTETPGLGARMTEDWFRKQFVGLRLTPREGDKKIFHLKAAGTKKASNELDAITGATGTSRGIEGFLNNDLKRFREEIWPGLRKQEGERHAKAS
jgi:Na+-transporting NADH:ubiquinone oxidoreductase subunit C